MNKTDVLFHEEDEYVVMTEDEWKILLIANHFKCKFWYDIEDPEGYTYNLFETDIYAAINKLHQLKENHNANLI